MENLTWRERFDRDFVDTVAPTGTQAVQAHADDVRAFIEKELIAQRSAVIDECIRLAGTHTEHNGRYCDTWEDMEWGCRSECVEMAITRLEALKSKSV